MNCPLLYEINTRCWLQTLSERDGREYSLANVPDSEFKRWQSLGFSHLWLMGVWTISPRSRTQALGDPHLRGIYDQVLPGWHEKDIPGSPFAIGDYEVSSLLGGDAGLRKFRKKLAGFGLKLILDFVPNHFGLDHSWVTNRPDLLITSLNEMPGTFREETVAGVRWIALAKDPYFPPWPDVVQIDYRRAEARAAMIHSLKSIAKYCDGVRCDMAMLILNDVFAKTWAQFPVNEPPPTSEFWSDAIPAVKATQPDFIFLAEAYWSLESRLQELGFDFTYDKHVYDCLVNRRPGELQRHLQDSPAAYVARSAHFLENHDEPRIAGLLSPEEQRPAALLMLALPGMRFLDEGQLTGARIHIPVQLGRYPFEANDSHTLALYEGMLATLKDSAVGRGEPRILRPFPAWDGNPTAENFIIIQWQGKPEEFELVVVNLAAHHRSQCRVRLEISALPAHNWTMRDLLGEESYQRQGAEMQANGLFLDLPESGAQIFRFQPV